MAKKKQTETTEAVDTMTGEIFDQPAPKPADPADTAMVVATFRTRDVADKAELRAIAESAGGQPVKAFRIAGYVQRLEESVNNFGLSVRFVGEFIVQILAGHNAGRIVQAYSGAYLPGPLGGLARIMAERAAIAEYGSADAIVGKEADNGSGKKIMVPSKNRLTEPMMVRGVATIVYAEKSAVGYTYGVITDGTDAKRLLESPAGRALLEMQSAEE